MNTTVNCYTDASYSQEKFKSVVAYKINNDDIKYIIYNEIKNTQAEILGIYFCIEYSINNYIYVDTINIYTDCQNAFKQDFSKYNININLIKIKGHQKMINMNSHDLIFKSVDKFARKTLRLL